MTTSMALAVMPRTPCLRYCAVPRHPVLEPLRVVGDLADVLGLLAVDEVDERLPRSLVAARVHVDLDEPVDRVDRRVLVLHPGDVVRDAVGGLAGLVPLDQRLERRRHRRRGVRESPLRDAARSRLISASYRPPISYTSSTSLPSPLHQPRVERIALLEALDVLHRDVDVEVVRALLQDVLARVPASCS